jgi:hypothetical protein
MGVFISQNNGDLSRDGNIKTIPVTLTGTCFGSVGDDGKFHKPRTRTIAKAIVKYIASEGYSKIIKIHEGISFDDRNDTMTAMVDVQ